MLKLFLPNLDKEISFIFVISNEAHYNFKSNKV